MRVFINDYLLKRAHQSSAYPSNRHLEEDRTTRRPLRVKLSTAMVKRFAANAITRLMVMWRTIPFHRRSAVKGILDAKPQAIVGGLSPIRSVNSTSHSRVQSRPEFAGRVAFYPSCPSQSRQSNLRPEWRRDCAFRSGKVMPEMPTR